MKTIITYIAIVAFAVTAKAQTVRDIIEKTPSYASCNYHTYPDSITAVLTPSPAGKKPFYISHYGRHGSRYISNRAGYETPYVMMQHADSLDELTAVGKHVLYEMNSIMRDTEDRWGELTGYGKRQMENIGQWPCPHPGR